METVDTLVAAVVTIAKALSGGELPKTTIVRVDALVITVNIVTLMHKVVTMVTETTAAMTTEATVLVGTVNPIL